jgi:hypothetical protein
MNLKKIGACILVLFFLFGIWNFWDKLALSLTKSYGDTGVTGERYFPNRLSKKFKLKHLEVDKGHSCVTFDFYGNDRVISTHISNGNVNQADLVFEKDGYVLGNDSYIQFEIKESYLQSLKSPSEWEQLLNNPLFRCNHNSYSRHCVIDKIRLTNVSPIIFE